MGSGRKPGVHRAARPFHFERNRTGGGFQAPGAVEMRTDGKTRPFRRRHGNDVSGPCEAGLETVDRSGARCKTRKMRFPGFSGKPPGKFADCRSELLGNAVSFPENSESVVVETRCEQVEYQRYADHADDRSDSGRPPQPSERGGPGICVALLGNLLRKKPRDSRHDESVSGQKPSEGKLERIPPGTQVPERGRKPEREEKQKDSGHEKGKRRSSDARREGSQRHQRDAPERRQNEWLKHLPGKHLVRPDLPGFFEGP
ncbi:MAG: hypothetical protein BWY66_01849 [bacterium ADurb.Bin374]|nr:MAG: hypothetical protein BWY66_01849 [bacterium ADurb.Bin374]